MARISADGNGPLQLMDPDLSKHVSIPLRNLFFENGILKADGGLIPSGDKGKAYEDFLHRQAEVGVIAPGAPATKPVMVIRAKGAGSSGNGLSLFFGDFAVDPVDASKTTFTATVTEVDEYAKVKPEDLPGLIGSSASPGKRPGLVIVASSPSPKKDLPKASPPSYKLTGDPASVEIPKNSDPEKTTFKLQARESGPDGANTNVEVSEVNATAGTFTLRATWSKTEKKITVKEFAEKFKYAIIVEAPASTAGILPPAAGSYKLSGGRDVGSIEGAPAAAILEG
jgi:hypothetical protein